MLDKKPRVLNVVKDPRCLFWLSIVLALAAIEMAVACRYISPAVFARPTRILVRLFEMVLFEDLKGHIWSTTGLSVLGVMIGYPVGCLIAIGMSLLGRAQRSGEYVLDFSRSIPLTTLVPIFLTIYGIGSEAKIAIASLAAALTTAITIWIGLKSAIVSRRDLIAIYQPPLWKRVFLVLAVEAAPSLIAALRLAVSTALILAVVAEMFIGAELGIGKLVVDKGYTDDRAGQYAAILAIGIVGFALNLILSIRRPLTFKANTRPSEGHDE